MGGLFAGVSFVGVERKDVNRFLWISCTRVGHSWRAGSPAGSDLYETAEGLDETSPGRPRRRVLPGHHRPTYPGRRPPDHARI